MKNLPKNIYKFLKKWYLIYEGGTIMAKDNAVVENGEFVEEHKKRNIGRLIGNIIFYLVLAVFAVCAVFGVINFNKVKDNEQPMGYMSEETYQKDDKTVTVYNYFIYKIVKVKSDENTTVSLKLWFLDDVK